MKDYRSLVRDALAALEITSATTYQWFGVPSAVLPEDAVSKLPATDLRLVLKAALKSRLYADFYCPGSARASHREESIPRFPTHTSFLSALSDANSGSGSRVGGWRVVRRSGELVVVERYGLHIWARPEEIVAATDLAEHAEVAIIMPKEHFRLSPGFYVALGNRELPDDPAAGQVRYYWNVESQGAASLMESLTKRLNEGGVAFRFKIVSDPTGYSRADAGVLYVLKPELPLVQPIVRECYRSMARHVRARTPAFAEEVAPGLGFAESPPDPAESFGTARCELLAEAALRVYEAGASAPEDRIAIAESCFAESGIRVDRPYLNPITPGTAAHADAN